MLSGSCLCGAVAYEVDADPGPIVHCHCRTCRKAQVGLLQPDVGAHAAFRWVRGEDRLGAFESSEGKLRRFCTVCGSQIVAERAGQPVLMLRLGCLDTAITDRPRAHIWRSDAASWYDPKDELPELPKGAG